MKTIKLLAIAFMVFTFSQCSDELFDIKFNLSTASAEFTIKPTNNVGEMALDTTIYSTQIDSLAKVYKVDTSNFKSIKVKNMKFTIISPADMNFDAVNSGVIKMSATGKPEINIAEFNSIPKGIKTFDIVPLDINLMPYLKKKETYIYGKIVTNAAIEVPVKLKLEVNFEVIVNPIKKK